MRTERQKAYDERRSTYLDLKMSSNPNWKGGRRKGYGGYIIVLLHPDDPFYQMAQADGVCPEHRYVMAQSIGRCLRKDEIVHHINHIRDDNRIENLHLVNDSDGTHKYIDSLEKKVKQLESELRAVKSNNHMVNRLNTTTGGATSAV